MKIVIATEAVLLAKNQNYKANKKEIETVLDVVMTFIRDQAKEGYYSTSIAFSDLGNPPENVRLTVLTTLAETGYNFTVDQNDLLTIKWGHA